LTDGFQSGVRGNKRSGLGEAEDSEAEVVAKLEAAELAFKGSDRKHWGK
jgi:hypothetical protein